MEKSKAAHLKRRIQPMPASIAKLLKDKGLNEAYKSRPGYQQNDYLRWIDQARREETKQKRLSQMLRELRQGNVYMGMNRNPLTSRKA
jgi:uncharacterized protein YdeI (YjbR/CyaY-like superfamily)